MSFSGACFGMSTQSQTPLDRLNEDDRKLNVSFKRDHIILDDQKKPCEDAFDVADEVIDKLEKQYNYLKQYWKSVSHNQSYDWYNQFQNILLDKMKYVKDQFLRLLYDNYNYQFVLIKDARTRAFFIKALNLLEDFQNLRAFIINSWPAEHQPDLIRFILLDNAQEQNMQAYTDVLKLQLKVGEWYKRMQAYEKHLKKSCAFCGESNKLTRCKNCKRGYYCSVDCQKKHWPTHKVNCKNPFSNNR